MQSLAQTVRKLAYRLWEIRGRRHGYADEDWLEAERQLSGQELASEALSQAVDESIKESFPASDPPASRTPDKPPVNADAKWAVADAANKARGAKSTPPIKVPNPPEDEIVGVPPETPKIGSRDAPGG